jgi:hypothetical protein
MQCPTIFRKYAKLKNKFWSPPKAWHNTATSIPFATRKCPETWQQMLFFQEENTGNFHTLELSVTVSFTCTQVPLFCGQWGYDEATCGSRRLWELKLDTKLLNEKFINVYIPECDGSTEESLTLLKGSYSQKAYNSLKQNNLESGLWISYSWFCVCGILSPMWDRLLLFTTP